MGVHQVLKQWVCAFLASVCALDLTSCANFKFCCAEWMQVLILGRRVHRYIDRANLVNVRALLASIEAVNETSALVARLEARHEIRSEEARRMPDRASSTDQQ